MLSFDSTLHLLRIVSLVGKITITLWTLFQIGVPYLPPWVGGGWQLWGDTVCTVSEDRLRLTAETSETAAPCYQVHAAIHCHVSPHYCHRQRHTPCGKAKSYHTTFLTASLPRYRIMMVGGGERSCGTSVHPWSHPDTTPLLPSLPPSHASPLPLLI